MVNWSTMHSSDNYLAAVESHARRIPKSIILNLPRCCLHQPNNILGWRIQPNLDCLPRPACEDNLETHANLRGFVAVFLAARGFFLAVAAFIFPLAAAPTGDGNPSLGCFAVRWWPWCSGWMRAASSANRSSVPLRFRRSSSRYIEIVLVVMAQVWQNHL